MMITYKVEKCPFSDGFVKKAPEAGCPNPEERDVLNGTSPGRGMKGNAA